MKKFSKICLIIVAVLGGMGLLLGGISALLGGGFGAVRRMAERGELDAGNWHIRPYELYYSSDEEDTEDDWGADDDAKVYTYEAAGIKNLDIDIDAAEIYVKQGTDDKNLVVRTYGCKEKYYKGDINNKDTLQIQYEIHKQFPDNYDAQIVIEIPKKMTFDTMDFDIGAADADFASGSVNCRTMELNVGAGELTGADFAVTGMTWSAFRPSDDCCQYSYLIPSNMFAVVVLGYVQEIFADLNLADSESIIADAKRLQAEIQEGIENYAYTTNSKGEKIYAFEVDGLGNASIMDDPNVPSLLAAPYLGYCEIDDEVYQATRRTVLSPENPYFYEGKYASGLGSSHTFYRYIWPIALSIQGLTTTDKAEKKQLLDQLVACDGGTGVMHESFHVDDPTFYSREWFSWANMMFCELVLDYLDIR